MRVSKSVPRCLCRVTQCHQTAAVAASVRLYGLTSAWLLCDDHASVLDQPDLPEWFEVDHVRPVSDICLADPQG